jgi:hypothetical protein
MLATMLRKVSNSAWWPSATGWRLPTFVFACLVAGVGHAQGERKPTPPLPDQLDVRVEAAVAQAETLRAAGDFDRALETLRSASSLVKKTKGNDHPDLLPILDAAGQILFAQGKLPEAEVPLTRAVALRDPLIEAGQEQYGVPQAAALLILGKIHAAAGRVDRMLGTMKRALAMLDAAVGPEHAFTLQARDELVRAVDILQKDLEPEHEVTARANAELAEVYAALGDHAAAAAARKRQYEPRAGHLGAGHASTLAAAGEYGRALALAGQWTEAIAVVNAAAAAGEKDAGCDRNALAELLRDSARLHLAVEDYSPAEEAVRRALVLDGGKDGGGEDAAALDEIMLVDIAAARGEFDRADEAVTRLVERLKQRAAAGGATATRSLRVAADVFLEAGAADTAAELLRIALEADGAGGPEAQAAGAEDQLGLARCLLSNGDAAAAATLGEQALKAMRRLHGPSHPLCLSAGILLAETALKARQTDDAWALGRRLIERRCPRLGKKEDERLARLFDGIAALLEKGGRGPDGERLRGDFISLRSRQFGDGHEYVADAYVNLANARQAAGGYADAIVFYRKAIQLQEAALGASHPDIAATLLPLARAHRALKQNAEATAALRRALAMWEETAGAEHPVTLATVKQLALAELGLGNRQAALPLMERLLAAYDKDPDTPAGDVMRLLTRLAEVHGALGANDAARRHLQRAAALEQQLAAQEPSADAVGGLAELARVQRLLGDEDEAQGNLAAARALAAKMQDAEAQLQRIESIAGVREPSQPTPPGPVVPQPPVVNPSPVVPPTSPAGEPLPARIEAAWKALRGGDAAAARADMVAALAAEDAAGRGAELPAADVLVALADMRELPLDDGTARRQYERALTIRRAKLGPEHPATVVAALRGASLDLARRDPAASRRIATLVGGPPLDGSAVDVGAAKELRVAVRHAVRIALAAEDAAAATGLIEAAARIVEPRDLTAVLQLLDHVAEIESLPAAAPDADTTPAARAAVVRNQLLAAVAAEGKAENARSGKGRLLMHRSLQAGRAGDARQARALAEAALAADRAEFGAVHPAPAADLLRLAALARAAGDAAASEQHAAASREARASLPAAPVAPWIESLRRLVSALLQQAQADEAVRLARAAIEEESRATGPRSQAIAVLIGDAARGYLVRGNTDRAMELLAEAVPMAADALGGGSATAVGLAVTLDRLRRPGPVTADNSPADERVAVDIVDLTTRELRTRALLPVPPAATSAAAGGVGGSPAPFIPLAQSPLRLRIATARRGEPSESAEADRSVADWLRCGWERHCLGDPSGSAEAFAVAVRRAEGNGSSVGEELLDALQESALAASDRGDTKTARSTLSRLGSLLVSARGADDPAVAAVAVQLADLVIPGGDLTYAAKMLDRARGIREKRFPAGSVEAAAVAVLDARLAAANGDANLARERLAALRATLVPADEASGETPDPRRAWLLLAAARLAVRLGDVAAARDFLGAVRSSPAAVVGRGRLHAAVLAAETDAALRAADAATAERCAAALLDVSRTEADTDVSVGVALVWLARAEAALERAAWRQRAERATKLLIAGLGSMRAERFDRDAVTAAVDLAELLTGAGQREPAVQLAQAAVAAADVCLAPADELAKRATATAAGLAERKP